MDRIQMIHRTKQFSVAVVGLVERMPKGRTAGIISRQMLRSATSVGSNYRAAQRARSRKEFASKIGIVLEECDETLFWLELLEATGIGPQGPVAKLREEADQLTAIFTVSHRTSTEDAM